jgi:putative endonuclease
MVPRDHHYYVYIVASRTRVLYVGVTNSVSRRTGQHKEKVFPGFTAHYNCERLVYYECYQYVYNALDREKQIKRWSPSWADLSESWWEETADLSTPLRSGRDDKGEV